MFQTTNQKRMWPIFDPKMVGLHLKQRSSDFASASCGSLSSPFTPLFTIECNPVHKSYILTKKKPGQHEALMLKSPRHLTGENMYARNNKIINIYIYRYSSKKIRGSYIAVNTIIARKLHYASRQKLYYKYIYEDVSVGSLKNNDKIH